MALTDKEIGALVIRAFPSLKPGPRLALLDLAKALRDDYAALVEAVSYNTMATTYLEDGENYHPPPLYAGDSTALRSVYLTTQPDAMAVSLAGLQNVSLVAPVFIVNLGPLVVTLLDTLNVSGLTPASAHFDFGKNEVLDVGDWAVVHYSTSKFVLDAISG